MKELEVSKWMWDERKLVKDWMIKWPCKVSHRGPVLERMSKTYSHILKLLHMVPLCPTWHILIATWHFSIPHTFCFLRFLTYYSLTYYKFLKFNVYLPICFWARICDGHSRKRRNLPISFSWPQLLIPMGQENNFDLYSLIHILYFQSPTPKNISASCVPRDLLGFGSTSLYVSIPEVSWG